MAGFSISRSGSWKALRKKIGNAQGSLRRREALAIKRMTLLAERKIKKGIRSGRPGGVRLRKNAPITILLKGSSKPLIDNSDLLGSVTNKFDPASMSGFAGVLRTTRKRGKRMMNIAIAQEFGVSPFTIKVTPKVRRFFYALSRKSGGKIKPLSPSKTVIQHPGLKERPFIRPVFQRNRRAFIQVAEKALSERGGPF